jgi:hypothetical protein
VRPIKTQTMNLKKKVKNCAKIQTIEAKIGDYYFRIIIRNKKIMKKGK